MCKFTDDDHNGHHEEPEQPELPLPVPSEKAEHSKLDQE